MSRALTRWQALGTTVEVVVTSPRSLFAARTAVDRELIAIDQACSRFRSESELSAVNREAGNGPVKVSQLFAEALSIALNAAKRTGGAVDPTVGPSVHALGYDRDFSLVNAQGPQITVTPAAGWQLINFDSRSRTIQIPSGCSLDLGATAKAWAADRAAAAAAQVIAASDGVLVNLGGDIAIAGRVPAAGWPVGLADDHRHRGISPVIEIRSGGIATSGISNRSWQRGGKPQHHIVDPATGESAQAVWRTVSVAGESCADANSLSTAAMVWGQQAPEKLSAAGVPARLVSAGGEVVYVGGWPEDSNSVARMKTRRASTPKSSSNKGVRRSASASAPAIGSTATTSHLNNQFRSGARA